MTKSPFYYAFPGNFQNICIVVGVAASALSINASAVIHDSRFSMMEMPVARFPWIAGIMITGTRTLKKKRTAQDCRAEGSAGLWVLRINRSKKIEGSDERQ